MALIVGVLLLILGTVALCVWWTNVQIFLQGFVVLSLLFWGLLSLIVGYAGFRAKRQLKAALHDSPAPDDIEAEAEPSSS